VQTQPAVAFSAPRTALAKARAHQFNVGTFLVRDALPQVVIYSLRLLFLRSG
jgi:hypothetical protein